MDLERYLDSTYPDHERLAEHPFQGIAQSIVRQAYPALAAAIEFVFLKSRRRLHEQLSADGRSVIIVDEGLTLLSAFQETLLGTGSYTPDHGLALALIPYAEAFKAERADDHALLCAAMIHEKRSLLRDLHLEAAQRAGRSALRHFLVLHEIAHFAVDTDADFVAPALEQVSDAIAELLAHNRILLDRLRHDDDPLADLDVSFSAGPSAERALMAQQTATYIEQLTASTEVCREASCDFVALLGFARLRLESRLEDGRPISPRELGDVLMIGLTACRLLAANELIRQTAQNIATRGDASVLHQAFSELQMRSNLLSRLAQSYFYEMLATYPFTTLTQEEDPGIGFTPEKRFTQGVERLHYRSVERILTPIEHIGIYHREEMFASDLRALERRLWGDEAPGPEMREAVARDLIGRLPI